MTWPPNRILVATDFSDSAAAALRAAAALARRTQATLDLVHVIEEPMQSVTGYEPLDALLLRPPDYEKARTDALARLATLAESAAPSAVNVHLLAGNASAEILALRDKLAVDWVVLGAAGMRGLRRLILGSVAERVLHRPGCPLLLVNDAPPTGEFKTSVVGQEYPDRATPWLELGLRLAHHERGELVVLHVLPARGYASDAKHVDVEPERAPEKLERLVQALDATVPVRIDARRGEPATCLTDAVRELGADLLIIGAERNDDGSPGRVTARVAREGLAALLVVWLEPESDEEFAAR
jgi:nucleotide-binding universal stress UspA family protein